MDHLYILNFAICFSFVADLLNLIKLSGSTIEINPESLSSHIGKKCIMLTEMDETDDPTSSQVDGYNCKYHTMTPHVVGRQL